MRNQEGKIRLHKKVHKKSFLCHFLSLLLYAPLPLQSDVLVEWPLWYVAMLLCVVFCVVISWVDGRKYENLSQFNTNWVASLRTWYYFSLCFSFSFSGYELTVIKKSHTLKCYSLLHKFLLKTQHYRLIVGNYKRINI